MPEPVRKGPTPGALAAWLYDLAIESGGRAAVKPEAAKAVRDEEIGKDCRAAGDLLRRYDLDEIYTRGAMLVERIAAGKRRGPPTLQKLLAAWADADLAARPQREYLDLDMCYINAEKAGALQRVMDGLEPVEKYA